MPNFMTKVEGDLHRDEGDPALLSALASGATYPGHPRVDLHETHASWVFVAGDRAYKVKKPLALGFLDYSTLELRHSACREEVRINQELAPGLYLGVRAIVKGNGGFRIVPDGAANAVEYAVEMCRFSEQDTFEGLIAAGALTPGHVAAAGRLLAEFHRSRAGGGRLGPGSRARRLAAERRRAAGCWPSGHAGGLTLPRASARRSWQPTQPSLAGVRSAGSPEMVTGTCAASTFSPDPRCGWSIGSSSTPRCVGPTLRATSPSWRWTWRRAGSSGPSAS